VLRQIVRSIEVNHPDAEVLVLLIDERPEEITDFQRWMLRGTVAATAFDRQAVEHGALAELVVERAKRLAESGRDVVVVADGLTRLVRALHRAASDDRPLDGGVDASALLAAKRFFGAARNAEEGGSLTIIATAVAGTGSHTDAVILEELADTTTTEIVLDRRLAERRVAPALDLLASAARHDDQLLARDEAAAVAALRRLLAAAHDEQGSNAAAVELLAERLGASTSNAALLASVAKG
jgi:transcription termination factor Rho